MLWTVLIVLLVLAAVARGTAWLLRNPPTYVSWCLPAVLTGLWVLSGFVVNASCILHSGQTGRCEPARHLPEGIDFAAMLMLFFGWIPVLVSVVFAIHQSLRRRSLRSKPADR